MTDWLTAKQAMEALGVRPQTLYAYVSRGRVEARARDDDPRKSVYRAADIERLARRKARGRAAAAVAEEAIAWGEPVLPSAITTVSHGRLYYRGEDAAALAGRETLEAVAARLWGAAVDPFDRRPGPIPDGRDPRARMFASLAARAAADPPARRRAPDVLHAEAASLLDGLADAVAGAPGVGRIHQRLARSGGCGEDGADLIRRALVLLADHELNASTFAARVAASTGASLAAAALAGLAALSGPLHGGMAARVQAFMDEVSRRGPHRAIAARQDQALPIPGFGHPLYPEGDPRARALLDAFAPPPLFAETEAAVAALTGEPPNIDFALTALAERLDLPPEAPFLLFATGRCAGWLAHALEQVAAGRLIRPRARYVGPAPDSAA
ncbi:MAG: citrate synthase family protein [Caulobacteraceae bacterium]|nr:citrate synthase family protein [Caulobacteraceae bacterium]